MAIVIHPKIGWNQLHFQIISVTYAAFLAGTRTLDCTVNRLSNGDPMTGGRNLSTIGEQTSS